jgi:isocitrate dehydrogenase kinase/phosphatase
LQKLSKLRRFNRKYFSGKGAFVVHRLFWQQGALQLIFFLSVMFGNQNNNNLQFDNILNNEAIVLETFIWTFGMACTYFPEFFAIPKNNN